jgi:hypothetical protein
VGVIFILENKVSKAITKNYHFITGSIVYRIKH